MSPPEVTAHFLPVRDCDLTATLTSGQAFRWKPCVLGTNGSPVSPAMPARKVAQASRLPPRPTAQSTQTVAGETPALHWEGIVARRWVRLTQQADGILAETADPTRDWSWLEHYLNVTEDLAEVHRRFPDDPPLREAMAACRGLRLLQQDPWECLASFILSSTKQIVHIRQIVERLAGRYGDPLPVPAGHASAFSFPSAARLARASESELRESRMGFRAKYLRAAAEAVGTGALDLEALRHLPLAEARARLMTLPGVGRKIADCVLLFSLGFRQAFPVDVWIAHALRRFYFRGRKVAPARLLAFTETHFGSEAGYAQQYLFHYARLNPHRVKNRPRRVRSPQPDDAP